MGQPIKLTWDDLLIQDLPAAEAGRWIQGWRGWLSGPIAPIAMSKFGDWYIQREDDSVIELSVLEGTCEQIAADLVDFWSLVNTQNWQEAHLRSRLVFSLHERGLIPKAGECYAFAPHPLLTGRVAADAAMVMPIGAWQQICAQMFGRGNPGH